MSAGYVAASVRGRAMAGHRCGRAKARVLAASSWPDLVAGLAGSLYGAGSASDIDRVALRRHCSEVTVWNLRVLAGWLPSGALAMLRALVGQFEIENIAAHVRSIESDWVPAPLDLGALSVAWPRVQACASHDEVRDVLRFSSWGDPGASDPVAISVGLQVSWARRLQRRVPPAAAWAVAAAAIVVARERFVFGREPNPVTAAEVDRLLGRKWRATTTVVEFVDSLNGDVRWVFEGAASPGEVWRAEATWWHRVESDAATMIDGGLQNPRTVVGAVASMLVDLRRVQAAVETAGRGPIGLEVFDVVA